MKVLLLFLLPLICDPSPESYRIEALMPNTRKDWKQVRALLHDSHIETACGHHYRHQSSVNELWKWLHCTLVCQALRAQYLLAKQQIQTLCSMTEVSLPVHECFWRVSHILIACLISVNYIEELRLEDTLRFFSILRLRYSKRHYRACFQKFQTLPKLPKLVTHGLIQYSAHRSIPTLLYSPWEKNV